jgi:hypothetical protein
MSRLLLSSMNGVRHRSVGSGCDVSGRVQPTRSRRFVRPSPRLRDVEFRRAIVQHGFSQPIELEGVKVCVLERPKTSNGPAVRLILLPTAHVSARSAREAQKLIRNVKPDVLVLEVCDERIDGAMNRVKAFHGAIDGGVLVAESVKIAGLPTRTFPGGVDEKSLLAVLMTKQKRETKAQNLLEDVKVLQSTGLFERVAVEVVEHQERRVRLSTAGLVNSSVEQIIFHVEPKVGELTSDIEFEWDFRHCVTTDSSENEIVARIMRRASELVAMSDCGQREEEMEDWQTAGLCSSLLLATREVIHDDCIATLNLTDGVIEVIVDRETERTSTVTDNSKTHERFFSLSRPAQASDGNDQTIALLTKLLNATSHLAERLISKKINVKDGEEIVASLMAGLEVSTPLIYLADQEMSKTVKAIDKRVREKAPGTKRYIFASIWSLMASSVQSPAKLISAIELERQALTESGDTKMPYWMSEVLIEQRNDILFDTIWNASLGEPTGRPYFQTVAGDGFKYQYVSVDSEIAHGSIQPRLDVKKLDKITILGVFGAAHVPGLVQRWVDANRNE